ncbi:hypothetical protein CYG49_05005 [Candidatus Saccharibacteria bacterium]|nr:MAG: hypothetical protein CYG49_05005 [Candidatus Saccharibacteria bacterium]
MDAIKFNRYLIGAILLLLVITGAGFYYASKFLAQNVIQTDHARTDASISADNVAQLKRLKSDMEQKEDIIKRTEQIVSDSSQYKYQDQIVQDVNAYAERAGVEILSFTFNDDLSKPAAPAPAGTKAITGVRKVKADITLKTPIPYDNFLRFLIAIEQNLTKMQVTGVNMSPDKDDPRAVVNPAIGIQMYIKQ